MYDSWKVNTFRKICINEDVSDICLYKLSEILVDESKMLSNDVLWLLLSNISK